MITCPLCQKLVWTVDDAASPYIQDGSTSNFKCPTNVHDLRSHFTRMRIDFHQNELNGLFVPGYKYTLRIPPFELVWNTSNNLCFVYEGNSVDSITEQHKISSLEEVIHLVERLKQLKAFL